MTLAPVSRPGSGRRKAAVTLVALGTERAAALLRDLPEEQVQALVAEVAALGRVGPEEVRTTLRELHRELAAVDTLPAPGMGFAKELLTRALGDERAQRVAGLLAEPPPFGWLAEAVEGAGAQPAAEALAGESPAVVALALAHLAPKPAARILTRLPEAQQVAVAKRVAGLQNVHPDTVAEVDEALRRRVATVIAGDVQPVTGPQLLAEILGFANRDSERSVMSALASSDPELAEAVRQALFTFDDVAALEPRALQVLLKAVDSRELALALKNADEQLLGRILGNLSERARDGLLEEIDLLTAIRPADVQAARQSIVGVARRLEEEGAITIARPEEE
jgi:flagellar motor switch protein FliG